jgi:hypothetical protein
VTGPLCSRVPREHRLKTWPGAWQEITDGRKTFEYRRNDRDFQVGDHVLLEEWDPAWNERAELTSGRIVYGGYTGRRLRARITYILQGQFGVPEGYAVLALQDVEVMKS